MHLILDHKTNVSFGNAVEIRPMTSDKRVTIYAILGKNSYNRSRLIAYERPNRGIKYNSEMQVSLRDVGLDYLDMRQMYLAHVEEEWEGRYHYLRRKSLHPPRFRLHRR
jgi:hypothetical protein